MSPLLKRQPVCQLTQEPGLVHLQQQAGHQPAILVLAEFGQEELLGPVRQGGEAAELVQGGDHQAAVLAGGDQQIARLLT